MKVFFVGAGPGDPELLTRKADRLLQNSRVCIYAGSLVSPAVTARIHPGARLHNSAEMTLSQILDVCCRAAEHDQDVVRLHSGDPSIYGAIREQMNGLDRLGIAYEVVPGVSAFQAAAAALKTELTVPEIAQTIILTRTAGRTPLPEKEMLENLGAIRATLCIFLSAQQTEAVFTKLIPYYGADCPTAVVYHASWPDETIVEGTLDGLLKNGKAAAFSGGALVLVGQALGRHAPASKLYDPAFSHQFREGHNQ
ncbi:MAG TPA: precorrin-4 C(11)-methyltransferase [Syntrophaceae bacterium]|nr:precorrin-4 C(11)-methyltransferase [Syntrophaceae bacterium]HCX01467.1 precorrin-4 C(11)-methyltransferase [Syntrophaceae bacterium]